MMFWTERIADETTHHYAELRQRRMPKLPALLMTLAFHRELCRAVLLDDQFDGVIGFMLGAIEEGGKA